MDINSLKEKKVGILGYGREGQSVARYLSRHGIAPVLFDKDEANSGEGYESFTGENYLENLSQVEVVFRSPGFWRLHPDLLEFEKRGGIITSQTIFFFENCPATIVGVTGTKGKGTTTTLSYLMAKAAGKNAYLTGNIGLDSPLDFIDDLTKDDLVYYELSSFQLQDLKQSPHIGVVLMVTADHLDHHKNLEEYHSAKAPIAKYQTADDFAIINKDFSASLAIGEGGEGQKLWVSSSKVSFGITIQNKAIFSSGLSAYGVKDGQLLSLEQLTLRGEHNLQNVSAALLGGIVSGFKLDSMLEVAKSFQGLEHRLELSAEKNGVKFYNDSYSTTPDTAIAAVNSFEEPIYLILGGSEKFLDYSALATSVAQKKNISGIFLIGQTAPRIEKVLKEAGMPNEKLMTSAKTFEDIFQQLKLLARPGDVVLLSPATASFDMFENYKERGNKFKQLSKNW